MQEYKLTERCKISLNMDSDKFVGIECLHGDFCVHFPVGFRLSDDEEGVRRDIRLLLNTIASTTGKRESQTPIHSKKIDDLGAPINSFIYVINDFYERGLYKERDIIYVVSNSGKVNWNRTIKTQRPYLQDDEAYYLKFVTKKNEIKDEELITQIHQYCLYASFKALGWIFTNYVPQKPHIKYNERLFLNLLKNKLMQTFNDKNRMLFRHMIAIVKDEYDERALSNFRYGVNRFEYVWEDLIDGVFGVEKKEFYFPATYWGIFDGETHTNPKLEPDTIMFHGRDVYVLDAKYYKYGETKAPGHLPESTSINKQITYGEYIAKAEKFKKKHGDDFVVYNAFLLPYNRDKWDDIDNIRWIGKAWGEWKGRESYSQIQGVLVDVKNLMEIGCNYNESEVEKLAALIRKHTEMENSKSLEREADC